MKYRARTYTEKASEEFDHFCDVLSRLHPQLGAKHKKNEKLLQSLVDVDWDNDSFRLEFVSLGKDSNDVRARENRGIQPIKDWPGVEERADITFHSQTDLNQELRGALDVKEGVPGTLELRFSSDQRNYPPWLPHKNSEDRMSYIGKISAGELNRLCQDPKSRHNIYAMNIREFIGDTATNKVIIDTALHNAHNFFYFNNGISAVATKIEADEEHNTLRCDGFSIINGAQTVRSITKAFAKKANYPDDFKDCYPTQCDVLIRITEIAYDKSDDEGDFITNIIRYNNTQNAIKASDFRSNDPVQRQLHDKFAKLSLNGKKIDYKNKRTGDRKGGKISIGMEDFIKTVHAFRFGPHDYFGGTKHLFDTSVDGGYRKLFGDATAVWTDLEHSDFEQLAGSWFVCEMVKSQWKDLRAEYVTEEEKKAEERLQEGRPPERPIAKQSLERRFLVFYTVGRMLDAKCQSENTTLGTVLKKLSKPKWSADRNSKEAKGVSEYTEEACQLLMRTYHRVSEHPAFTQRNWFRKRETLEGIVDDISRSKRTITQLPLL